MLMAWLRLDISIHALRKESDCRPCLIVVGDIISIHALRKESDKIKRLDRTAQKISIHALRKESDSDPQVRLNRWNISIHALRKESDLSEAKKGVHPSAISIHALRKESDLIIAVFKNFDRLFQSTLSVRRATRRRGRHDFDGKISIHALRKESDNRRNDNGQRRRYFNPRSP